ncbi:hypothetical protein K504DRAFT_470181 [Pleomassaria siparia CBS 279.74]|uniref:Uncharacterized protein n=1 Tax=Pleomassaria siparia CBS 279.74 TaxID=1314801 RepID=A0A6G1K5U6_9PLEO|nr:hypothetical protein K504DRAFT_470181 [Pleomassaria siparia CBS 279.74]
MHTPSFLLVVLAPSLSLCLPSHSKTTFTHWQSAANSTVTCSTTSDKMIAVAVGPQLSAVLNDACAAMMPICAYQDRVPPDTICVQTVDWELDGAKSSVQSVDVEDKGSGENIDGWAAKFSVTPALQSIAADTAGVFWTKADCYGYFAKIVADAEPAGCHSDMGSGAGSVTVGGTSSLAGTVFSVEIIEN